MEELNLSGYKGFKTQINLDLMETLYTEILQDFANITSQNLRSGTDHSTGVGYQWAKTYPDINSQILEQIGTAYNVDPTSYEFTDNWVLVQTNESWIDNPVHDHKGGGSLVVVVYIMADPTTDSISFFDDVGNETRVPIQSGDVLIFPSLAPHKPNPTSSTNHKRVSYNMTLNRQETETPESKSRMDICNACDRLMQPVKICKECHCFMPAKVLIPIIECPLGKWGKIDAKNIFGTGSN